MAVNSVRSRGRAQGKLNKISFRTVIRIILNHPFLLLTLIYLIILYRYFPFLFSLLVSASPVLICTAVLLGILLIHGQQNSHRVGNRNERSIMTESSQNADVDYSYNNGRFGEFHNEAIEKEVTVSRGFEFADFKNSERVDADNDERSEKSSLDVLVAEVTPNPQETHPLLGFEVSQTSRENAGLKSEVESVDSVQSSKDSDSDSDESEKKEINGESSKEGDGDFVSPFAWTESDQRILQELRSSEIEKNEHLESLIARAEDDDENEDEESIDGIEEEDDADDEEEEEEEEEDGNIDVEKDGSKQVTLWTEEDEKNLRHLGCSELERNLRLENLLARRRAKRNFSMISERNLIDLDKFVPPPPISTARVNPFDNNSHNIDDTSNHNCPNNTVLPPIPGSAPSVTLPRQNPFDSPCTSPRKAQKEPSFETGSSSRGYNPIENVQKPEFVDKNRKEALFRRYESFSAGFTMVEDGSSTNDSIEFNRRDFVFRRHETFNTRTPYFSSIKPVFVPQNLDGGVWHPILDRQLSHETHDTESVQSGTSSDTETSTVPIEHHHDQPDEEEEAPHENDVNSSHIETASESSEAIDSQYDDDEQEQDEHMNSTMEIHVHHVYPEQEVIIEGHDNHNATSSPSPTSSSSSSSSEHGSVNENQVEHEEVEASGFSSKESVNMSEASHMSTDDDHHPVEPVYDTSPSAVDRNSPFANPARV